MGLQPIDLQTMYSQISTVARQTAHQQQGVQLSEAMQQVNVVRQNQEKSEKVQQTEEQEKSGIINQNGKNTSGRQEKEKKNSDRTDLEPQNPEQSRLKEPYLGQHIDITR